MRKEHLLTLVRIISIFDCFVLASYVTVGFFVNNLEFAWRLLLLGLALYAAIGIRKKKRSAAWILAIFCSTAVFASVFQILVLMRYPDAENGHYTAPILAFIIYSLSLAGLYSNRCEFRMPKFYQHTIGHRYVPSVVLICSLVLAVQAFASDNTPLSVDRKLISLGKILRGTALQESFRITNTSQSVLYLSAKPSCGCTVLRIPQSLKPGENTDLPFYIHTFGDRPGEESKSILLTWKDDKQDPGSFELEIQYQVLEGFQVYQAEREIAAARGEGIMIWSWNIDSPPNIAAIAPNALLTFTLEKLSTRRGKMLRLRAQPYQSLEGHGGETVYAKLVTQSGGVIEIPFHISNQDSGKEEELTEQ
jgi:hypothetical protein